MSGCSWHRNVTLLMYFVFVTFHRFLRFSSRAFFRDRAPLFCWPSHVSRARFFIQRPRKTIFPGFVFKDQGKLFFQVFLHAGLDWAVYTPGQPVKVWPFKWKICETQLTCFGLQGNCSCRNLQFPSCFPSGPEIKANTLNHFCSKLIQKCFSSFRFNQMLLRSQ